MTETPIDILVKAYRDLRDKKSEMKAAFDKAVAPVEALMSNIEVQLLDHLNKAGVDSMKAANGAGTVYRSVKRSFKVDDVNVFRPWAESTGNLGMFESRVAATALQSYVDDTGTLPPGITTSTYTTVNVRK